MNIVKPQHNAIKAEPMNADALSRRLDLILEEKENSDVDYHYATVESKTDSYTVSEISDPQAPDTESYTVNETTDPQEVTPNEGSDQSVDNGETPDDVTVEPQQRDSPPPVYSVMDRSPLTRVGIF